MREKKGFFQLFQILLTFAIALALVIETVSDAAPAEPIKFTFISGSPGGGWYSQSGIISKVISSGLPPDSKITIIPGSTISNMVAINQGEGHMAFTMTLFSGWAATGTGPIKQPLKNIRAIACLDSNFIVIVLRDGCPINSLREVKEKKFPLKIAMQRPTTDSGGVVARYLFAEYGWGPPEEPFFRDLRKWGGSLRIVSSHGEATDLIRDGHIDMWVAAASFEHPPVVELTTARKVKFMPVDDDVLAAMKKKYNLPAMILPANTFKYMDMPTPSIAVRTVLITSTMQPEDLIYRVTKALADGREDMCKAIKRLCEYNPKEAWKDAGYDLHLGASRYYKEMGFMQ